MNGNEMRMLGMTLGMTMFVAVANVRFLVKRQGASLFMVLQVK
jgi:hypothetical protein